MTSPPGSGGAVRGAAGAAGESAAGAGVRARQRDAGEEVDAMMLACMGAALEIEAARELSPARRELELTSLRDALVGERKGAMQRAKHLCHAHARRAAARHIRHLRREVASLERRIDELMASDEELDRQRRVLTSVKGIGPIISAVLLSHMPELGTLDAKSAATWPAWRPWRATPATAGGGARSRAGAGSCAGPCSWARGPRRKGTRTSRRSTSGSCRPGSPRRWRRWPWCASW